MNDASGYLSGTTLGRYRVGALIGRGGMGEVYRAEDVELHPCRRAGKTVLFSSSKDRAVRRIARRSILNRGSLTRDAFLLTNFR